MTPKWQQSNKTGPREFCEWLMRLAYFSCFVRQIFGERKTIKIDKNIMETIKVCLDNLLMDFSFSIGISLSPKEKMIATWFVCAMGIREME